MPRQSRVVQPGLVYHVTQRGVDRQRVFGHDGDRRTYLQLLEANRTDAGVAVHAWCLMNNHVHWVVTPTREDSLAVLFRRVHGRYAQYLNARLGRDGHLWQNRYFACALAGSHYQNALRYVELNPVRSGLVVHPAEYRWSSAQAHLLGPQGRRAKPALDWQFWRDIGQAEGWRQLLSIDETTADVAAIRRCTYSGKPFGSEDFVLAMQQRFDRQWRRPGRPRKTPISVTGTEQSTSVARLKMG